MTHLSLFQDKRLAQCVWWLFPCLSVVFRYLSWTQTSYANGWDAYFYLVQVKAWIETGQMHSPEASLIYPLMRLVYTCTGDYVAMYKCTALLLVAAFCWVVVPFRSRGWQVVLPMAWLLYSPHLTYFAAQYPKNMLGLVLFVAFVRCLPNRGGIFTKWQIVAAGTLLLANYFGHRLTFSLAILYLLFWGIGYWYDRLFIPKILRIGLIVCVIGVVLAVSFPGALHWSDLERLRGVWKGSFQFAPWSFVQSFGWDRISVWWQVELLLSLLLWGIAICTPALRRASAPLLLLGGILLFPCLEWSLTGLSYRFFLVWVLCTPLLLSKLLQAFAGTPSSVAKQVFFSVLTLFFCISAWFSWKSYRPEQHDPSYARYEQVTRQVQLRLHDRMPTLLIAHNALAEYYTFTAGIDAMPWLPEYSIPADRLWRLATGVQRPTLCYFSGTNRCDSIEAIGGGYLLLPESVWQAALKQAQAAQDTVFLKEADDWRNPSRIRPGYLLRRKNQNKQN